MYMIYFALPNDMIEGLSHRKKRKLILSLIGVDELSCLPFISTCSNNKGDVTVDFLANIFPSYNIECIKGMGIDIARPEHYIAEYAGVHKIYILGTRTWVGRTILKMIDKEMTITPIRVGIIRSLQILLRKRKLKKLAHEKTINNSFLRSNTDKLR